MKNNFVDLLDYCYAPALDNSPYTILIELTEYLKTPYVDQGTNFNIIPLERIIYLSLKYQDNEEIQEVVREIFEKISFNYQMREKLLNRIYMSSIRNDILN